MPSCKSVSVTAAFYTFFCGAEAVFSLNAPDIAAGYDAFVGAIRNKSSLDGALRELLVSHPMFLGHPRL